MNNPRSPLLILAAVLLLLTAMACSTTRRLQPGQVLYTGVNKFDIRVQEEGEKLPGGVTDRLKSIINVKPNNPLISPYVRTPFPIGLWVYNNWNDSAGGIKGWLYKKLVAQPVLVSDVRPQVRATMMEQYLADNGYFGSKATADIEYDKRNEKKARINYTVNVAPASRIDTVIYIGGDTPVAHFIDSLARKNDYLRPGSIFCVDSLSDVRVRIANRMRNRGYYYFRPEYIEFMADTTITPGKVAIKMMLSRNVPSMSLYQYKTDNITTILQRRSNRNPGVPDTIESNRGEIVVYRPQKLRENLVPSCITFRKGKLFSVRDMDRTQTRLSRLGIFNSINIQPIPADTSAANPTMDVFITAKYDRPMTATMEVNATSKSNSYIGPGLEFGISHNNLFGGAEKLTLKVNGSYEWQTGSGRSSVFNSYEFGISSTLAFPRLLAPGFFKRIKREINWTTFSLSAQILNRPHYFKMAQYEMGMAYEWHPSRNVLNSFTPFKLTYTKLLHTTHEFDSIMNVNPAIALSFQSQFIPQMSYTYTLDKYLEREQMNRINLTATVTEAGNIFSGIWSLCGQKGQKKLFGTPFSQFVKGQVQFVYGRRLVKGGNQWLVSRVLVGAAHAYGNSTEVPYSEQFYIGGANSIRAFTVRSIGPGSYRAPADQVNGYFDQTGTFKFELNTEYRFPIVGILHGAVFLDAGNIWLLKDDPYRPGGTITAKDFLKDIALGTGVGLRVDLGMIVVRGDLGYGLHNPAYDLPRHYFNIKFKKAFAFHLAIGYPF